MTWTARRRWFFWLFCFLPVLRAAAGVGPAVAARAEEVGVRAADGLEVSLFADDDLAHDVFCLTIDARGRVVVSGPGYVRILVDEDGDGKADRFEPLVDGPKTGAQGMFFDGSDLICTGDAGLIRYRDRDGDDRADGPPELLLRIKTGAEHHAHSVQKGPDGWWYVIAGNQAQVGRDYVTLRTSPVKAPAAGTLLRLKPDFSGSEVVADGFRNAYDFAFTPRGDLFTYDSDGERDVTLPWYRPTRVFHVLPGCHAGWVSRSWKRPDYLFDMPPVLASLGRGSPTGVVCYRHTLLPPEYRGALLVADWTYGRVVALPLPLDGDPARPRRGKPVELMTGVGPFGFAPTDLAVAPDGSLYVSVGGRGTRGGVYRLTCRGVRAQREAPADRSPASALARCLAAPQPLSSWSRARWEPLASALGADAFARAALDQGRPPDQRVRALEILTEKFGGVDPAAARLLAASPSADVRAVTAWSIGRSRRGRANFALLIPLLQDENPRVVRWATEALLGAEDRAELDPVLPALARQMGSGDRQVRQAAARVVAGLDARQADALFGLIDRTDPAAELTWLLGRIGCDGELIERALLFGARIAAGRYGSETRLDAVRLLQLALGDVGPSPGVPPVFEGYHRRARPAGRLDEQVVRQVAARLAGVYPTGSRALDIELSRLLAMMEPDDAELLDRVLGQIGSSSHPTDDVHQLIVAACLPARRSAPQRAAIARALLALEPKVLDRQLKRDTNWEPRIAELYGRLVQRDPRLPAALASGPNFGLPGHVLYLPAMARRDREEALALIARRARGSQHYRWTNDVVFALAEADGNRYLDLIRRQYENDAVRGAVTLALARKADPADRDKFVAGLRSSQLEILSACLDALAALPASEAAGQQIALVQLLRRLGRQPPEYRLREKAVKLLRRNLHRDFGLEVGRAGHRPQPEVVDRWTAYVRTRYPAEARRLLDPDPTDMKTLQQRLAGVDWHEGDAQRGQRLFQSRSCGQCHGGPRALGPDLSGVARRFSRRDLFAAIALPNLDVSPQYQTTLIETTSGQTYSGLVIYESIDGLLLRNLSNQTIRIESDEIQQRGHLTTSLMPEGLLEGLSARDLADLYAYLRSL